MADDPTNQTDPIPRRKVYQPTLFAERRRRRASPWLVIPGLLLILGGALWALYVNAHHARFVATAGEVVFASDAGSPGTPHLWTMRGDGSGARQITSGPAADTAPAFAPGGSQIAFLSDRDGRVTQVFIVDADGQNLAQVTRNAGAKSQPTWSPGSPGLLGYAAGGALYDVSVGGDGGGEADRLLPPPPNAHQAQDTEGELSQGPTVTVPSYAWSPAKNGGLAAVEDTGAFQALAVMPSLAAPPTDVRQTPQGAVPLIAADQLSLGWNGDGTLLAVAALNVQGAPRPTSGLLLFEGDGSAAPGTPPSLVSSAVSGPQNPVFSPDGTQVLVEAWNQPDLASRRRLGLVLIPTGGGQPHFILRGDASEARFSPDGGTIFFLAARPGGGRDLCRVGADGSGFARLTDGRADVSGFSVSPQAAPG